ncbi:hypothetical protein K1719_044892 [Acacia pycnantha]|nr:hypothetical protein K1719_044892 [Acacia pycnantha]
MRKRTWQDEKRTCPERTVSNAMGFHDVVEDHVEHNAFDGVISIDCGASIDYVDEVTGIWYQTDESFIESGTNHRLAPNISFDHHAPTINRQLMTVRSFPEGERNCYTLRPKQEKQKQKYLMRAIIAYGNYDLRNQVPELDLYLGVNYWTTFRILPNPNGPQTIFPFEIIMEKDSSTETIQVCLVNTGRGIPFINSLELRPLNNSLYHVPLPLLYLIWVTLQLQELTWAPGSSPLIGPEPEPTQPPSPPVDPEPLPPTLKPSASPSSLFKDDVYDRLWWNNDNPNWDVLQTSVEAKAEESVYELPWEVLRTAQRPPNNSNLLTINMIFGDITNQYYLFLHFAEIKKLPRGQKRIINVTFDDENSLSQQLTLEYLKPITLISNITKGFTIKAATDSDAPPILNALEICKVVQQPNSPTAEQDIKAIKEIQHIYGVSKISWQGDPCVPYQLAWDGLNCSYKNNIRIISLPLPEFLATLPNLKFINVTGNNLTGSIPKALREKANLEISFVRRISEEEIPKTKESSFSYSEVLRITKNFETTIGEGGFGKVYLGTLEDDTKVAVKLLSPSSKQGYKEFKSEAQLLTVIHHRNLVALVGFCDENDVKALIYEYMDHGDLGGLLSDKNQNVIKWSDRLQVAVDAAKGLEYLHNGCMTPIIHRDLKPSNILLNKFMVAKIADFGLSRAFTNERDSHLSTQPAGTPGYIDPEFQRSGKLDKRSDIYSFGMILLQLITGHPPIRRQLENVYFIIDWIRPKIECGDIQGIVDQRLNGEFQVSSVWKAVETAMSCIEPQPIQRPDISYVLNELKECLAMEIDHANSNGLQSQLINHHSGQLDSITTLSAR